MSEEEKEFKADHFENIEELVKTCKMWVTDDDYDAYCRFFDIGAMEEILNFISTLQKELYKKDNLILDLKEKLNNIQFEVETAWRKIEKLEDNV